MVTAVTLIIAICGINAGRGQLQQPANVNRRDKMPGGMHDVRSQYFAGSKCFFYGLVRSGVHP